MAIARKDSALYIGWDVGGRNCDRNGKSRDALVILDADCCMLGQPWRGNLRKTINDADSTQQWLTSLLSLCQMEERAIAQLPDTEVLLAIDTPLGFSKSFQQLLTGQVVDENIGTSATNPYLFRYTEHFLFDNGLTPLSAIKDMIGSQATKGMHALAKFAPNMISTGVWSDGNNLAAIEAYPSACKTSATIAELLQPFTAAWEDTGKPVTTIWNGTHFIECIDHEDKRDALRCALIAWLSRNNPDELAQPEVDAPPSEGWIFVPEDALHGDIAAIEFSR
jgi:hypothetical protein